MKGNDQPFDSIESAHDFVRVLCEAVADAKKDIAGDIQRGAGSRSSRQLDALRIAYYSVEKLELHMQRSRRILNDLRSLRRLLFDERAASKPAIAPQPMTAGRAAEAFVAPRQAAPAPAGLPPKVSPAGGKNGSAVAA